MRQKIAFTNKSGKKIGNIHSLEADGKTVQNVKTGEEDKLLGSVTAQMISDELQNKGYSIDKKDIIMDESIKSIGNHYL